MLDQLLNYLNTNGGLLVILGLVLTFYLSGAFFRQLTQPRSSLLVTQILGLSWFLMTALILRQKLLRYVVRNLFCGLISLLMEHST